MKSLKGLLLFALVLLSGCFSNQTENQSDDHRQTNGTLVDQAWQELFGQSEVSTTTPSFDMTGMPKRLVFFADERKQEWYVLFAGGFPPASNSWFYAQMSCVAGHGDGKDYPIVVYIVPHEGASKGMFTTFAHQRQLIFRSKADAEKAMADHIWQCGQVPAIPDGGFGATE